jgi:type IV pilus assembly protein PilC
MPQFNFRAKSIDGKETKGVRDAESEYQLARMLRQEGYVLVKADAEGASRKWRFSFSRRAGLKEKIFFCKNLQVMVSAGVSLPRAVGILADQSDNKSFSKILIQLKDDLIKGNSFSAALSGYPEVFSDFFCSMAKVGEETGTLANVLEICAQQMEKDYALKSKIKGAMVYPAVILTAMVGIGILMLATVVPQLAATFDDLKVQLPATTRFIIGMGKFAESYWWVIIIAAAVLVGIFSRLLKTTGGKKAVDDASLKFPAIAPIVRNVNSAYTLRNLSALVGAGVSLPRALVITADTVSNGNYARALLAVEARVKKGEKFSEAIKNFGNLYPPTMIQMIAVGEETGETSNILIKLAEFYENEVDEQTKNFAAVVEPMLMIVIGAAVGFFAVSMVQPMYSMMDAI